MSAPGSHAPWSEQQLSWLQAMGHVVYLDPADVPAPAPAVAAEPASVPAARQEVPPRARAEPLPRRAAAGAPPPNPPRRAAAAATGFRLPDRLQIALLRASGRNPADPQVQALMASWPLAELRADPAAKRALWPQLRALRRKPAP
ncbi:alanine acetyltransferase [Stenotrophomonas sp. MMGLT7]|uniref:alanine acetyltransferase n=1 Tax=Stenotrophomonas sp. MMGLT7 TaxID=2901227 RepID=UPI001E44E914|nr:alanine acetyltransferase [Stenotrophomonas sp. MMGLT7]MCD7100267.1 alanine acetyltransferase [Stenotrophomonas sp. MMGLT7]